MIGKQAPALELPSTTGGTYKLPVGQKPIALFFFPKAGTAVCTAEACSFRDAQADNVTFKRHPELEVVGISTDSITAQTTFADENKLSYPVLSDEKNEARKAYGVNKQLLGLAPGRETFFIDAKGVIRGVCDSAFSSGAHLKFVEKMLQDTDGGKA